MIYGSKVIDASCRIAEDDMVIIEAHNIVVIALYISPSESLEDFNLKLANVSIYIRPDIPTVVCGDLNAPLDRPDARRTKALKEALHAWGLWTTTDSSVPTFVSHQGRSTIDIFAVNRPARDLGHQSSLTFFEVTPLLPTGISLEIQTSTGS